MRHLFLAVTLLFSTAANAAAFLALADFNDIIWPGTAPVATDDEFISAGILFSNTGPAGSNLNIVNDPVACCDPSTVVGDGTRYLSIFNPSQEGPFEVTITNPAEGFDTFGLVSFEFSTWFPFVPEAGTKLVITGFYEDERPPIMKEVLYDAIPDNFQLVELENIWADVDSIRIVSDTVFPAFDNFLFSLTTPGIVAPQPAMDLEEPINGEVHSGIGNLRGWAIAPGGIEKVEIFIDGEYAFDAPYGGLRTDVGDAFPDIEDSENSGFSLAYGYANLEAGQHTVTARATTVSGDEFEASSTFTVLAFDKTFIFPNDVVDVTDAEISSQGDEIILDGVEVDGKVYDLKLKWRTAEQGFEIIEIE